VLASVAYWARKSGWIVIYLKGYDWVNGGHIITKSKLIRDPVCWDQPKLAMKFLHGILNVHGMQLLKIPLRTQREWPYKLKGKSLYDLVEYGSVSGEFAGEVTVHLRNELAAQIEYPVLVVADDYNCFYFPSKTFCDPESRKYRKEHLQPSRLTISRIFMDMHKRPKLAFGTFLGGTTERIPSRIIEPYKPLNWVTCPAYSFEEFEALCDSYERLKWIDGTILTTRFSLQNKK